MTVWRAGEERLLAGRRPDDHSRERSSSKASSWARPGSYPSNRLQRSTALCTRADPGGDRQQRDHGAARRRRLQAVVNESSTGSRQPVPMGTRRRACATRRRRRCTRTSPPSSSASSPPIKRRTSGSLRERRTRTFVGWSGGLLCAARSAAVGSSPRADRCRTLRPARIHRPTTSVGNRRTRQSPCRRSPGTSACSMPAHCVIPFDRSRCGC